MYSKSGLTTIFKHRILSYKHDIIVDKSINLRTKY